MRRALKKELRFQRRAHRRCYREIVALRGQTYLKANGTTIELLELLNFCIVAFLFGAMWWWRWRKVNGQTEAATAILSLEVFFLYL